MCTMMKLLHQYSQFFLFYRSGNKIHGYDADINFIIFSTNPLCHNYQHKIIVLIKYLLVEYFTKTIYTITINMKLF